MKRNGEIDFFRFIFAICIVVFHFNDNFRLKILYYGNIAVEFFFLVSGFLLARHAANKSNDNSNPVLSLPDETWHYLLQKIKSFYKYYLGAFVLQIIVRFLLIRHESFSTVIYNLLKSIPIVSLSFMGLDAGTDSVFYIGNTWYLSSFLIAILVLYPLLLKKYDFSVKIACPLIALAVLGYFYNTYQTLNVWQSWSGLFYAGVIRAVGEIALGCCLYPLCSFVMQRFSGILRSDKTASRILLTILKFGCYAIVLIYATGSVAGHAFEKSFCFHALFFCAIGILLSFSGAGLTIPDSKFTRYLGKISLPIFIYHGFIRWSVKNYIDIYHAGYKVQRPLFFAMVILAVIVCVALMHATDFLSAGIQRLLHRDSAA